MPLTLSNLRTSSVKHIVRIAFSLIALALLAGCTMIEEGNFGVEKSWSNQIANDPKFGSQVTVLDDITQVTQREFLMPVENVRPKDKMGVLLEDLDVTYSIRLVPEGAIRFYKERGDLTCPAGLNGCVIGVSYLKKDAAANIGNTIRNYDSAVLLDDRKAVEEQLKADFQKELNTLYGNDVFVVTEAKIASVQVAKSVEERIQAVALISSEKERSRATLEVLETREDTSRREYLALVNAAKAAGMSIDQALEYKRLEILRDMPGNAINLNVDTK